MEDPNPTALWHEPAVSRGPLLVTVPHAGRIYRPALLKDAIVGIDMLRRLEDRYCDALAAQVPSAGFPVLVARAARADIDLNRRPDDLDDRWLADGPLKRARPVSARARAGLGIVPTQLAGVPNLWRGKLTTAELAHRVATLHEPFHRMIAERLDLMRRQWGAALLIDLHSMPSLPRSADAPPVDIVLGNRFGTSAAAWISQTALRVTQGHGLHVHLNAPYAGGYTLDRHGHPAGSVHALQIEVDRRLYLDAAGEPDAAGVGRIATYLAELCASLSDLMVSGQFGPALGVAAE